MALASYGSVIQYSLVHLYHYRDCWSMGKYLENWTAPREIREP